MSYIRYHRLWVWLNAWLFILDELSVIVSLGKYNPMVGFKFLSFIAKKEIREKQQTK